MTQTYDNNLDLVSLFLSPKTYENSFEFTSNLTLLLQKIIAVFGPKYINVKVLIFWNCSTMIINH